jgi:hypothetical protein
VASYRVKTNTKQQQNHTGRKQINKEKIIFQHPVALSSTQVYVIFTLTKKKHSGSRIGCTTTPHTHTTAPQQNDVSRFGKIPYME